MQKVLLVLLFILLIRSNVNLLAQKTDEMSVNLQTLFEWADERNRELNILDYSEKIAKVTVREEKKKLLPSIDASVSVSYNGDGLVIGRDFSNRVKAEIPDLGNSFVLEASQVIYAGGAFRNAIEMAKLNCSITQLDKELNRQNIRFMIVAYYLDLLKLNNQVLILEKNIEQTTSLLEQMKAKYEQGTMLYNNVIRYELQLQSLDLSLLQVKNKIEVSNNDLVKMLQLPTVTRLKPDKSLVDQIVNSQQQNDWLYLAKEHSPQIKKSGLSIEKSVRNEKLVRAEKLPRVFAFAGNHLNGPITIEIPAIDKNFNYWYAGIGVKYNIASLYKSNSKRNIAKLSTQISIENNEKVKEDLSNEIEDACIHFDEAVKIYETQLKNVELASENYAVIHNRYLNDLVLITEMLDAENARLDAELKAANAQINVVFYYYQLKKLTGTI